jgi:signal transduction histidine kinase
VRGDELRLKQILLNLGTNALKFTPPGGKVEIAALVADGDLLLRVTDTGIGIAEEDQERIFQPFMQARNIDMRTREGTGLGLPLTRRLVELHGGVLELSSKLGEGTTVIARLPATRLITKPRLISDNEQDAERATRASPDLPNGEAPQFHAEAAPRRSS